MPNIRIVVAGTGPEEKWLRETANHHPERIEYLGQISYGEVLRRTIHADLLFALYDPAIPNSIYASPNKVFEAMMCGKPIVVNQEIAASRIVLAEDCGLTVPYGDRQALRSSIATLAQSRELRDRLGRNGRRAYDSKYGWNIMERRLLDSYKALESEGRARHD
jgi:glycosyltransferase involved in cell wall biosynthesis